MLKKKSWIVNFCLLLDLYSSMSAADVSIQSQIAEYRAYNPEDRREVVNRTDTLMNHGRTSFSFNTNFSPARSPRNPTLATITVAPQIYVGIMHHLVNLTINVQNADPFDGYVFQNFNATKLVFGSAPVTVQFQEAPLAPGRHVIDANFTLMPTTPSTWLPTNKINFQLQLRLIEDSYGINDPLSDVIDCSLAIGESVEFWAQIDGNRSRMTFKLVDVAVDPVTNEKALFLEREGYIKGIRLKPEFHSEERGFISIFIRETAANVSAHKFDSSIPDTRLNSFYFESSLLN